jgi:hypothetical protein
MKNTTKDGSSSCTDNMYYGGTHINSTLEERPINNVLSSNQRLLD